MTKLTVTLNNLSHTYPEDIDALLVSPTGANSILMSDTGGSDDINNVTLTFDATATSSLPSSGGISSGTYRPTNYYTGDSFPSPAPGGSYNANFSVFNGTNLNGEWRLYIVDAFPGDTGYLAGGWSVSIATDPGDDSNNNLQGTIGDDMITGLGGDDTLVGGAGNDTLVGGAGNDTLVGGAGDNVYTVDSTADIITENANEGVDTINTSVDYTIADNVENLTLLDGAINGTGNALNNVITGNSAANTLDGGAGNDTLVGGAGDDVY
ncbi:calcium-binding protein, partial [Dolichospermum planctonicum]|uniref:calcium-binding protein n=1 Tax=Dolichospermum planctonicum TaxID=136072 RepID=UPI002FEE4216